MFNKVLGVLTAALVVMLVIKGPKAHKKWIFNSTKGSIVKVLNVKKNPKQSDSGGTGFAIKWQGQSYIMTNAHVCGYDIDKTPVKVIQLPNGKRVKRKVLKTDPSKDLCLVEGVDELPTLKLNLKILKQFDKLHVLGHPFLRPITYRSGFYMFNDKVRLVVPIDNPFICAENNGTIGSSWGGGFLCELSYDSYVTDLKIFPGNSGSPIVDNFGYVRGVVFASGAGEGLVIKGPMVKDFLRGVAPGC